MRAPHTIAAFGVLLFLAGNAVAGKKCEDVLAYEKDAVRSTVINNEFRITRTLTQAKADTVPNGEISYETLVGPELLSTLESAAKSRGVWMDIGIGEGNAIEEALGMERFAGLRFFGVAPYSPIHVAEKWKGIQAAQAGRVEIAEELLEKAAVRTKRKIAVATDVYGALSYVSEFDQALAQVLESLDDGGEFFFVLQKFRMNDELFTGIRDAAGNKMTMEDFLRRIPGIEFVSSQVTADRSKVFRVRRTGGEIRVPRLKLKDMDGEKTPPRRSYQIATDS